MDKVYFYRDKSLESERAKKVLDGANIKYEEIFSNSNRVLPRLVVEKSAISFDGEDGVRLYASFFILILILRSDLQHFLLLQLR